MNILLHISLIIYGQTLLTDSVDEFWLHKIVEKSTSISHEDSTIELSDST